MCDWEGVSYVFIYSQSSKSHVRQVGADKVTPKGKLETHIVLQSMLDHPMVLN